MAPKPNGLAIRRKGAMATDSRWRADPFGLHEERFFNSDDVPTTLVRDDGRSFFDELPEPYKSHSQPLRSPRAVADLDEVADQTGPSGTSADLTTVNPAPPLDDEEQTALVSNHDRRPETYAFCPRCGTEDVAGGVFCGECGQSLAITTGQDERGPSSPVEGVASRSAETNNPTEPPLQRPSLPPTTAQILPSPPPPRLPLPPFPPPTLPLAAPAEVHPPAVEVKDARSKLALYTSPAFVIPMVAVAAIVVIAIVLSSR
jgi:hypothetical protein